MTELDTLALDAVVGGQTMNTTTVTDGNRTATQSLSNYAYCASQVQQACNDQNPAWLGLATDRAGAAACTLREMPRVCGTPPSNP